MDLVLCYLLCFFSTLGPSDEKVGQTVLSDSNESFASWSLTSATSLEAQKPVLKETAASTASKNVFESGLQAQRIEWVHI